MRRTINRDRPIFWMVLSGVLAGVAIGALAGNGLDVFADNLGQQESPPPDLNGPLVVPYDGYLMLDSAPIDGSESLTFHLHSGEACTDCEVWSETHDAISFTSGRFSVGLGTVVPISQAVLANDALFLSIDVNGTPLAGRQAIEAVPYAVWAGNADDLNVAGNATIGDDGGDRHIVNGKMHLTNTADASLSSPGALMVGAPGGLNLTMDNNEFMARDNGAAAQITFQNDGGNVFIGDTLSTRGNVTLGDATSDTHTANGSVTVTNDLTVNDNFSVTDNATLGNATSDSHTANGSLTVTNDLDVNDNFNVNDNATLGSSTVDRHTVNGKIHLTDNTDASLGTPGALMIGDPAGSNVTMDGNEILARNNGELSNLNLQVNGGDVDLGDTSTILMGYERKVCNNSETCTCPSGKKAIGGGGWCDSGFRLKENWPQNETTWETACRNSTGATPPTEKYTYVLCARIGD